MATIKLTTAMRESICKKMLKHAFHERWEELVARQRELTSEIYQEAFPKVDRSMMQQLPEKWLPTRSSLQIAVGSSYMSFSVNGWFSVSRLTEGRESESVRVPHHSAYGAVLALDVASPLAIKAQRLHDAIQDFRKEVDRAWNASMNAVSKCSTVNRLRELWPEAEPFLPKEQPRPQLPALPIAALNTMLQLPIEEGA